MRLAPDGARPNSPRDAHRFLGVPAEELGGIGDFAARVAQRLAVLERDQRRRASRHARSSVRSSAAGFPSACAAASRASRPRPSRRPRRQRPRRRASASGTAAITASVEGSTTSIMPASDRGGAMRRRCRGRAKTQRSRSRSCLDRMVLRGNVHRHVSLVVTALRRPGRRHRRRGRGCLHARRGRRGADCS